MGDEHRAFMCSEARAWGPCEQLSYGLSAVEGVGDYFRVLTGMADWKSDDAVRCNAPWAEAKSRLRYAASQRRWWTFGPTLAVRGGAGRASSRQK